MLCILWCSKKWVWRRQWHSTPALLPGKSHGRRSLEGCGPWGLLRVGHDWATSLSLFTFHALEKEMATHSSVLAWRIPGPGESCGLLSMGLHRVGHDWSDLAAVAVFCCVSGPQFAYPVPCWGRFWLGVMTDEVLTIFYESSNLFLEQNLTFF